MSQKLSLDRDFTRFFDDPTFPHKVTVCVGDKRISCSGALLAQQSSVLEKKFREDGGVLMFEELLDVNNSNHVGIEECIYYLHGADLQFCLDTLPIVLKFSSIYQVQNMFEQALFWLENHLDQSRSVKSALNFLKVSRSLNMDYQTRIKSLICTFIRLNRELFGTECENYLDKITGPDLLLIIGQNPVNSDIILKKWASLSVENGNYIVENHTHVDFINVFPNYGQFSSFVAILSSKCRATDKLRTLLNLQKTFFESQISQKHQAVTEYGTSSDNPNTRKSKAGQGPGRSGTNLASSSDSQSHITKGSENRTLTIVEPCICTHDRGNLRPLASSLNFSSSGSIEEFKRTQLYIGNLPPGTEENTIKRLFRGFGKIADVRLKSWNNGKSFGFISFENSSSAHNLLQRSKTRNYEIDGYTLVIDVVHQQNPKDTEDSDDYDSDESSEEFTNMQLYIGNLPPATEENVIKRMFCGFGRITDVKITFRKRGKNFGFITFEKSISAYNLFQRSATKVYELYGNRLVINLANNPN